MSVRNRASSRKAVVNRQREAVRRRLISEMRNSRLAMPHALFPAALQLPDEELGRIFKWQMKYIVSKRNVDEKPKLSKEGNVVYRLLRQGTEAMVHVKVPQIPKTFESLILPHVEHMDGESIIKYLRNREGVFEFPVELVSLLKDAELSL